jgi:hypothetical protein
VRFAPDERSLAFADTDSSSIPEELRGGTAPAPGMPGAVVNVLDLPSGRLRHALRQATPPLTYSDDSRLLATGFGWNGQLLRVWDVAAGAEHLTIQDASDDHHARSPAPVFAADGGSLRRTALLASERGGPVVRERAYDLGTGQALSEGPAVSGASALWGGFVLTHTDGEARVVNTRSGEAWCFLGRGSGQRSAWTSLTLATAPEPTGPAGLLLAMTKWTEDVAPWERDAERAGRRRMRTAREREHQGDRCDVLIYETDRIRVPALRGWRLGCIPGDAAGLVEMRPDRPTILVAISRDDRTLGVWDLPLRAPWPLVLSGAAVPPGLVLLGVVLRRAWGARRNAPAAA